QAGVLSNAGLTSPRKREYGHWSEVVSRAGKVYYYNRVTEQSQWIKPDGWEKAESVIFPVIDRMERSREESGFSDTIQTDCVLSDDDMDVSYGNSPNGSSSSLSIENRPQSSKENQEDEKAIEEEAEEPKPKNYYRADCEEVALLHEKFHTENMRSADTLRSSCAFEIEFATQQTQMYRARALARTAMAKAGECQGEVTTLSRIQKHLKDSRQHFQSNFEPEMRRILKGPEEREEMDTAVRNEADLKSFSQAASDVAQLSETSR
ncbi:hypothetical protein PENTCL1PPCAC_30044, partial [Pristionchus entomophagus]